MRGLLPTTSDSIVTGICEVMSASRNLQAVELGNLGPDGGFDAVVQRHMRRRTAGAHAGETHECRSAFHRDEFDIAAVGLEEGTNAIENGLNAIFVDAHARLKRNPYANGGFPQMLANCR